MVVGTPEQKSVTQQWVEKSETSTKPPTPPFYKKELRPYTRVCHAVIVSNTNLVDSAIG